MDNADGGAGFLAELKADPVRVGLKTLFGEIEKRERVCAIGLPGDLFADAWERHVAAAANPCGEALPVRPARRRRCRRRLRGSPSRPDPGVAGGAPERQADVLRAVV